VSGGSLNVLVVDDNVSAANALARVLSKRGDHVIAVYDGSSAIAEIHRAPPDVVLTDLKMEPVDGMAVLTAARGQRPPVEVIVFTAYGGVDVAVEAMRLGARDFLTKPVTVEQVFVRLDQLRPDVDESSPTAARSKMMFVAQSASARALLATLHQAADLPSPVWIEGEMGSGRGHAALALHRMSASSTPFAVKDLGRDQPWPKSGTVLLPNVDDLPDDLQKQLRRSLTTLPDRVRVVTTSSSDARRLVAEGRLRADLYYNLAVVQVTMPPLRHRPEDILPMLDMFLAQYASRYSRVAPPPSITQQEALVRHAWPGNVRELVNIAERAVVMGPSAFEFHTTKMPAPGMPTIEEGFSLSTWMERVEREVLVEAMALAKGDRNQMGRLLGLERNTLRYKLNKYDLL
jgi:DNA-binding NtrC family response regulator